MYFLILFLAVIVFISARLLWREDKTLETTNYTIESEKIPESFSGFRIAHVSDLQNCQIGRKNEKLLKLLSDEKPDIIAITGDLADSRHTRISVAVAFASEAAKIADVYYVTGNHEARLNRRGRFEKMDNALKNANVNVLHNRRAELVKGGEKISLIGVDDPIFGISIEEEIKKVKDDSYSVLLAHHPEFFDIYCDFKIDLALTGHAHGGQIRLPKKGGLFAPGQGVNPKFDAGLYEKDNSKMVLSRGIGNSLFPFRINNRPEVCMVELKHI